MQGIERTIRATILIRHAFFLDQPHLSMENEMIFSNTAITVDIAAKIIKRKNIPPISRLAGIELNTSGRILKISAGPWKLAHAKSV